MNVTMRGSGDRINRVSVEGNIDEIMSMLEIKRDTHEAFANVKLRHESTGGGIADEELVYEHHFLADEATQMLDKIRDATREADLTGMRKKARENLVRRMHETAASRLEEMLGREQIERLLAEGGDYDGHVAKGEPSNGEGA